MKSERVVRRKEKTARRAGAFSIARTVQYAGCLGLGSVIGSSHSSEFGARTGSVEPADGFYTARVWKVYPSRATEK